MAVVQDDAAAAAVELEPQGAAFVPLRALPAGRDRPGRARFCLQLNDEVLIARFTRTAKPPPEQDSIIQPFTARFVSDLDCPVEAKVTSPPLLSWAPPCRSGRLGSRLSWFSWRIRRIVMRRAVAEYGM